MASRDYTALLIAQAKDVDQADLGALTNKDRSYVSRQCAGKAPLGLNDAVRWMRHPGIGPGVLRLAADDLGISTAGHADVPSGADPVRLGIRTNRLAAQLCESLAVKSQDGFDEREQGELNAEIDAIETLLRTARAMIARSA